MVAALEKKREDAWLRKQEHFHCRGKCLAHNALTKCLFEIKEEPKAEKAQVDRGGYRLGVQPVWQPGD